ncbi:MAG: S8 family peptidase [Candidatus Hydrogenedentota bacterium]
MFKLIPYKQIFIKRKVSETIDWGVRLLGAPDIWKLCQGQGVKVAVLDTGTSPYHKDLKESFIFKKNKIIGINFSSKNRNNINDHQSHGTHVTGIIAANKNGLGIIGVAPKTKIIPVKVMNDYGEGDISWIVNGIYWVIENIKKYDIKVISMSLGSPEPFLSLKQALIEAKKNGVITVCAVGNQGNWSELGYPARYAEEKLCIAVGAIASNKKITEFSTTGEGMKKMGVVAPGFEILSTIPENRYASFSGTSMATPHIAGVLSLAIAKHQIYGGKTPLTNIDEAYEHLKRLTLDIGKKGADRVYGLGLPILKKEVFKSLRVSTRL